MDKMAQNQLLFKNAYSQLIDRGFCMTNYGCYICQKTLRPSDYEDHIAYHGRDVIPYLAHSLIGVGGTFTVSYGDYENCYFNFTIESNTVIDFDKIVIVRPEGRKQFYYIDRSKIVPSEENKKWTVFIDYHMLDIEMEIPFFLIFRISSLARQIEKYAFYRKDPISKYKIGLVSNVVPQHAKLQYKSKLPRHIPLKVVRDFGEQNYNEVKIMESSSTIREYLVKRELEPANYAGILVFLLQMEDYFIMSRYEKLNLKNVALNFLGGDNYSLSVDLSKQNKVKQFLSVYDDIVVTTTSKNYDYYDGDIFNLDFKANIPSKFFGNIYKIEANMVFFSLRGKTRIPIEKKLNVYIYPNRIPFRHQYEALKRIPNYNHILNVLLPSKNDSDGQLPTSSINFYNDAVERNPEQSEAVRNIVNDPNNSVPYILFGPPGTGKSTTIIECILQLWKTKPDSKILVTSASNTACDEISKRLCNTFEDINPEGKNLLRIFASSSEKRIDNTDELIVEASNFAHGYHFYPSLDSIYLFRIVIATLTVCGKLVQADISSTHFTHIFIDECAASTEPEALMGIVGLMGPTTKLILSGDPKQLGPVLKCQQVENFGLGVSMMERLLNMKLYAVDSITNKYDKSIQTILRRNYRTHPEILAISNDLCYSSQLIACGKPELTQWVIGWDVLPLKKCPIIFHVVYGKTEFEKEGTSSMNFAEIEVVMDYVRDILRNGINGRTVQQTEIGIISPYKKQYSLIRQKLDDNDWYNVKTGSAETFQGQEKPIIIISTVKSWSKNIDFLGNLKRLNVILTRAQSLMIIVGNPRCLQNDKNWLQVLQYFQKKKAFTGKYFRLRNETVGTSFNLDLLPDVPKNCGNVNNESKQFKSNNNFSSYNNAKITGYNRNTSNLNKKQSSSPANTGTTSSIHHKGKQSIKRLPLTSRESDQLPTTSRTSALNKPIQDTSPAVNRQKIKKDKKCVIL